MSEKFLQILNGMFQELLQDHLLVKKITIKEHQIEKIMQQCRLKTTY